MLGRQGRGQVLTATIRASWPHLDIPTVDVIIVHLIDKETAEQARALAQGHTVTG